MYPLHDAVSANNLERVFELIGTGQDPNGLNEDELPPLQILCGMGSGNALIAEMLIMAGADPNCFDPHKGETALHAAIRSENVPLVEELLKYSVDIHFHDADENRIFTTACEKGNREIVRALIAKGANVNEAGQGGYTPLMATAVYDRPWIAEMLLAAGATVNQKNELGNTALHVAYYNKRENMQDLLLEHGADPAMRNNRRLWPAECTPGTAVQHL
jgi:ankyrin repeat protein